MATSWNPKPSMLGPLGPSIDPWPAYASLRVLTYIDATSDKQRDEADASARRNRPFERHQVSVRTTQMPPHLLLARRRAYSRPSVTLCRWSKRRGEK